MVAMTARVVAAILMLAFSSAATIAQPMGSATPPAPAIHPATGLKFPSIVGRDIRLARSIDHGRSEAKPELGYSLTYLVAPPLDGVARVNIFNGGLTAIPSGADSRIIAEQFDQLLDEIRQVTPEAEGMTLVNGPAECFPGGISFRCATLRSVIPKTQVPVYSTLAVTGYRNHFFSIWLEWNGTKAAPMAADAYMNDLVDAMTR